MKRVTTISFRSNARGSRHRNSEVEPMRCPYCSKLDNKVIDSRLSKDGRTIDAAGNASSATEGSRPMKSWKRSFPW